MTSSEYLASYPARLDGLLERARHAMNHPIDHWNAPIPDWPWTLAQILEHLHMSNAPMVPVLQSAARQAPAGDTPLKHSLMGRMIMYGAGPKGNVPAPQSVIPAPGPYDASVLERFESDVRALQDLAQSMVGKDLGRVKVTSPLASFVRYSLYDALEIIIQHTERHVGQVERFAAKMSD